MTVINQAAALRRFHQGLFYLLGTTRQGETEVDQESFVAILAVMAYLGAYAFPGGNLHDLRKRLVAVLEPLKDTADIQAVVEKATALAEVFRRPWSEPGADEPTI